MIDARKLSHDELEDRHPLAIQRFSRLSAASKDGLGRNLGFDELRDR
jgi:hypothetical protein